MYDYKLDNIIIGVDIGRRNDFTAVTVVEVTPDNHLHVKDIFHLPQGCAFSQQVRALHDYRAGKGVFVCDITGMGGPIAERLSELQNPVIQVTITAGREVNHVESNRYNVPKATLVSSLATALGTRVLHIPANLEIKDELVKELKAFSYESKGNYDMYNGSGAHDDLVLSLSYCCWYADIFVANRKLYKPFTPGFEDCERVSPWIIK